MLIPFQMYSIDMKVTLPQGEMLSLLVPATLGQDALLRILACVQLEAGDHLDNGTTERLATILGSPPPPPSPPVNSTLVDLAKTPSLKNSGQPSSSKVNKALATSAQVLIRYQKYLKYLKCHETGLS